MKIVQQWLEARAIDEKWFRFGIMLFGVFSALTPLASALFYAGTAASLPAQLTQILSLSLFIVALLAVVVACALLLIDAVVERSYGRACLHCASLAGIASSVALLLLLRWSGDQLTKLFASQY